MLHVGDGAETPPIAEDPGALARPGPCCLRRFGVGFGGGRSEWLGMGVRSGLLTRLAGEAPRALTQINSREAQTELSQFMAPIQCRFGRKTVAK